MAQTTGGISRAGYKVEVSTNGSDWTDISGAGATVTTSGGEQLVGEQNTADGSAPVVTGTNKVGSRNVEVRCLYTETSGEAWKVVSARYNGAVKTIYLRYSPAGGGSTTQRFSTANNADTVVAVPIINCVPPELDAGSGDPALFTFTVITPKLKEETIA